MRKHPIAINVFFIILGIVVPVIAIVLFAHFDLGALFNSWEDENVNPDWRYLWLVIFKLSLYFLPPLIGMLGFYINDKRKYKYKFIYYLVKALNFHFLVLLSIKLICDSILELDKVWGFTIFNSIKDVQTLIGYIVTFFIKKNIKIEPGLDEPEKIKTTKEDSNNG